MNIIQDFQNPNRMTVPVKLAYLLLIASLLWMTGAPFMIHSARASVTSVSDRLSNSEPSVPSAHFITFTNSTSTSGGTTLKITFDPGVGSFTEVGSAATTTDYAFTGATVVTNLAACTGAASEVYPTVDYSTSADENLTFTVCPNDSIASGAHIISIGSTTPLITNPGTPGTYVIRLAGTMESAGGLNSDTRVAILNNVVVTASIDSTFTFTVSAVPSGVNVNGTTTNITTTDQLIPFGSLLPNQPKVAAQRLNVTTNASHGFTVTVNATSSAGGALVDGAGDTIDFFKDGNRISSPTAWTAPSNVTGQTNTYGHFGLTTTDNAGDPGIGVFGADQWVGNFFATTTRAVMYNSVASDGVTNNVGSTTVGYAIQVGSLQEAGTDYQTTFTYVATPIF